MQWELKKYLARWVFSTHLKNISQNGSFPQLGVKIKNTWNHHLVGEYPPRKIKKTWDPPKSVKAGKIPIDSPRCQTVPMWSLPGGCALICARPWHQEFQVPQNGGFPEPYDRRFWGWISPYISLTYSLYRWGFLHFRYLKSLVMLSL